MLTAIAKSDFALGRYYAGRDAAAATVCVLQNLELLLASY